MTYVGRFAPSPTGPLHDGSLLAAVGSWLDARARGGRWLVRIEDVDTQRCRPGADAEILRQLAGCGLFPDGPVWWQSRRHAAYQDALDALLKQGQAYACACSRADIARALGTRSTGDVEQPYPGTCRGGLHGRPARAWRLRVPEPPASIVHWHDRRLGPQCEDVARSCGDFVLKRADGMWAYQLAVVVDDAAQGVTDVVRGEDLAASTARQMLLQQALGAPTPTYLHLPLVHDARGRKLSKQAGDAAFEPGLPALRRALTALGFQCAGTTLGELLASAVARWRADPVLGCISGNPVDPGNPPPRSGFLA